MRQKVPRPACLPSLPTLPPGILSRGWAGSLSPSAPTRKMQHLFRALPQDCVLHSAPQGHLAHVRASFLLLPSWAKCTGSCPALVERPSSNLPATPACCSSSCCLRLQPPACGKEELLPCPLRCSNCSLQMFCPFALPTPLVLACPPAGTTPQRPMSKACFRARGWVG